ncbi:MAG: hypothetical protein Q8O68_00035 [Candidatus Daviesbacteria bacterium]|nr:hypothetical protein [Candidatus Daviesbacteria bacterium]
MAVEYEDSATGFSPEKIAFLDSLGERRGEDPLWRIILDGRVHRDELFSKDPVTGIIKPKTLFESVRETSSEILR